MNQLGYKSGAKLRRLWMPQWPFLILAVAAFSALLYGVRVLVVDYWIRIYAARPAFFEDFGYFYLMGQRVLAAPGRLYESIDGIGTWVIDMHELIFHMYSPMAALMFSPLQLLPMHPAYIAAGVLAMTTCVISVLVFMDTLSPGLIVQKPWFTGYCVLIGLAVAPTLHDAYSGNVSAGLLLLCVLYIRLVSCEKFILAGVVLAAGFWLKFYPIVLVILVTRRKGWWKCLLSFALTVTLSFLLSLLWIPLDAYKEFYLNILPAYSRQTTPNIFNQSLHAVLMRLSSGLQSYLSWVNVPTPVWVRAMAYGVAASGCLTVFAVISRRRLLPAQIGGAVLMALIPMVTPVGWGYTYMLSIPVMLTCLVVGLQKTRGFQVLVMLSIMAFLVPSYFRRDVVLSNRLLRAVVLNRYSLANMCLVVMLIREWIKMRAPLAGFCRGASRAIQSHGFVL